VYTRVRVPWASRLHGDPPSVRLRQWGWFSSMLRLRPERNSGLRLDVPADREVFSVSS
jgi:hypothetical protein